MVYFEQIQKNEIAEFAEQILDGKSVAILARYPDKNYKPEHEVIVVQRIESPYTPGYRIIYNKILRDHKGSERSSDCADIFLNNFGEAIHQYQGLQLIADIMNSNDDSKAIGRLSDFSDIKVQAATIKQLLKEFIERASQDANPHRTHLWRRDSFTLKNYTDLVAGFSFYLGYAGLALDPAAHNHRETRTTPPPGSKRYHDLGCSIKIIKDFLDSPPTTSGEWAGLMSALLMIGAEDLDKVLSDHFDPQVIEFEAFQAVAEEFYEILERMGGACLNSKERLCRVRALRSLLQAGRKFSGNERYFVAEDGFLLGRELLFDTAITHLKTLSQEYYPGFGRSFASGIAFAISRSSSENFQELRRKAFEASYKFSEVLGDDFRISLGFELFRLGKVSLAIDLLTLESRHERFSNTRKCCLALCYFINDEPDKAAKEIASIAKNYKQLSDWDLKLFGYLYYKLPEIHDEKFEGLIQFLRSRDPNCVTASLAESFLCDLEEDYEKAVKMRQECYCWKDNSRRQERDIAHYLLQFEVCTDAVLNSEDDFAHEIAKDLGSRFPALALKLGRILSTQ